MASDLTEKYVVFTHDHARSCQGREYICSCGHDDKITKAADELVNIIQAQDRRIAELEAALEQCQSVLAMFIDPDTIMETTVLNAYALATAAEAKARALIPEREG